MSWSDDDHALMRLYPSRSKTGDSVLVRLQKHQDLAKTAAAALMAGMLDPDEPDYENLTDEDPIKESGYYADNDNNFE